MARVALVIGNSAYRHAPPLDNPRNDARAFARVLRSLDFEVDLNLDVGRLKFHNILERFHTRIDRAEAALFFYAGHGLQVKGLNYLIPVDSHIALELHLTHRAVALDRILDMMVVRARSSLIFLDACRDNPIGRSLAVVGAEKSRDLPRSGFAEMRANAGSFIAFATAPDHIALDGREEHSPFTEALLNHIETPDITVGDMMIAVRNQVITTTDGRQQPWEQSNLREWFYFKKGIPAERALEQKQWHDLIRSPTTLSIIEAFIVRYPAGAHFQDAKDLAARRLAVCLDTDELERFIVEYPDSKRRSSVERRLAAIIWARLKRSNDREELRSFIDRFVPGTEAQEARSKLAWMVWRDVRYSRDVSQLDAMIAEFSGTRPAEKAARRKVKLERASAITRSSPRLAPRTRLAVAAALFVTAVTLAAAYVFPSNQSETAALGGSAVVLATLLTILWARPEPLKSVEVAAYFVSFAIAACTALFVGFSFLDVRWHGQGHAEIAIEVWALVVLSVAAFLVARRRGAMATVEIGSYALICGIAVSTILALLLGRAAPVYLLPALAALAAGLYFVNMKSARSP